MLKEVLKQSERIKRVHEMIINDPIRKSKYNPWYSDNRTKEENREFKENLLGYYMRCHDSDENLVRCMVTDKYLRRDMVIGSHIWKRSTIYRGDELRAFGLEISDRGSPRNGLLMCQAIEQAFDVLRVTFLYNPLDKRFYFKTLDPSLLDDVAAPSDLKFSQLNDKSFLHYPDDRQPFKRLLIWHAKCAIDKALDLGWIHGDEYDNYQVLNDISQGAQYPRDDDDVFSTASKSSQSDV